MLFTSHLVSSGVCCVTSIYRNYCKSTSSHSLQSLHIDRLELTSLLLRPSMHTLIPSPMQYYISGTIIFLIIEMTAQFAYYRYINKNGGGTSSLIFLFVIAILSAARNSLSFFLLLIVCMGLSVVRENLGGVMGRVRILTACHFVFGGKFDPASVSSLEPGRKWDTDRRARRAVKLDRDRREWVDCSRRGTGTVYRLCHCVHKWGRRRLRSGRVGRGIIKG